jgi:hypothetical protein
VAAWLEAFLPAWLEGRLAEFQPKIGAGIANLNRAPSREQPAVRYAGV